MAGQSHRARVDWGDLLRQAKRAATVEAVYGFDGKPSGAYIQFYCPFHDRADQSDPKARRLSVSKGNLGYRCWHRSCDASGDVLTYLNGNTKPTGPAFAEAVSALCNRVGIAVPANALAASSASSASSQSSQSAPSDLPPVSAYEGLASQFFEDGEGEQIETSAQDRKASGERTSRGDGETKPKGNSRATPKRSQRLPARPAKARDLWARARPIGLAQDHPARLWVSPEGPKWGCWLDDRSWPDSVRWLPEGREGGGSLIAAIASLPDWIAAWPGLPEVGAVQAVCLDGQGNPALDHGGLGKRSYGPTSGAGVLIAASDGLDLSKPLAIAEGVADAMGLATWLGVSALAILGTAGYRNERLATDLARLDSGAIVCGDCDPPGLAAQAALIEAIQWREGAARAWQIGEAFASTGGRDLGEGFEGQPIRERGEGLGGKPTQIYFSGGFDPANWAREQACEAAERTAIEGEGDAIGRAA